MCSIKAVFVTTALLISSQIAHAEESTLMQDKLVSESYEMAHAKARSEATVSTTTHIEEHKKSC